ncbi:MAG: PAS domain S-box protein [Proteobacteria bacterium]|nr:PAS domain S-box protein [Pseudomonadota bacterium]
MANEPSRNDLEERIHTLEIELEQLKKSEDISGVLLSIARAVSLAKSLSDFYATIHKSLQTLVFVNNFAIGLIDEKKDSLYFPYVHDEKNNVCQIRNISNLKNQSLALTVIRLGKPLFMTRKDIDRLQIESKGPLPSVWIGTPLFVRGNVIGLMVVQDYSEKSLLSHDDVSILVTVSDQVALAIERKMNEEALHESESKYRDILDNIIEGYYEVDLKGNMMFFNSVLCQILGYSENELMNMNNRVYMGKESFGKVFKAFNHVYNTGEKVKAFECPLIRKNKEEFFAEISVSLIRTRKSRKVGFRGIVRDISERKMAEDQKKRMEAQLHYAMKMESIGTLAGGIAHNFNNLLMAIRGYAELMLLDLTPEHSHYKMLVNIDKQVGSGSRLTSQLIGYAREGKYEVRSVDLNLLVLETVDTFAMTRKEIRTHFALADDLSGITADQGQIEQVLMNLCVNAADAMPNGGDLFFNTYEVTDKDFGGDKYDPKPDRYICLSVTDTGGGMNEKVLPHIFEPFFTTKDISSGTGLGLASTYGIIKAHGGYINVMSEINRGSTFFIYIPVAKEKTAVREKKPPQLIKGNETILFVDDDPTLVGLGFDLLTLLGYTPLLAEGGEEALKCYRENQKDISLVILDMIMPGLNGGDVYDMLKAINKDVRVLLSSGYSIDGKAKHILDRGCNGFIQKPFEITALSHKIREILDE